jgi:1-acyl-sn-glycerol-3-phosphate acyltransferase
MSSERHLVYVGTAAPAHEKRLDAFYWRVIGTTLSFVVFGVGAVLLGSLVFPLLHLVYGRGIEHRGKVRATLRRAMRFFVRFMRGVGVLDYEFRGVERLGRPGQLIIANHPSLIDVVFLLGFAGESSCVVKRALFTSVLTRGAVSAAGYISNDPTPDMIEGASAALERGESVIMFPEGTRTRPGEPLCFHRGAANIALRAARVVTPVYIRCRPTTLTKAEPWYRIPSRRVQLTLEVGKDIDPALMRASGPRPMASRAFNELLQTHFESELGRMEGREIAD